MKKYYTLFMHALLMAFFFVGTLAKAQEMPQQGFNYQGVARDADGELLVNTPMSVTIALRFGGMGAPISYSEVHDITTDPQGIFSMAIGHGTVLQGGFDNLPWGSTSAYLETSLNGESMGITPIRGVPFAVAAGNVHWQLNGAELTHSPAEKVHVSGALQLNGGPVIEDISTDGTFALNSDAVLPTQKAVKAYVDAHAGGGGGTDDQNLVLTGDQLSIENGLGTVDLAAYIDDADADPTNEFQTLSFDVATNALSLSDGNTVTIPSGGTDADADPTNEIQDLSLSGTELSITSGSTIDLAPIVPPGGTDDQNLQLTGDVLSIEGGTGSVDLATYINDADADPTNEIDVTNETGILLGDGTVVTGLIGTAEGQVPKWNATTSTWEPGTDETGTGGGTEPTGLEALDQGNGVGWRLIGRNQTLYAPIGSNAVDLSLPNLFGGGGATGRVSFATGMGTIADGVFSTGFGFSSSASGEYSTAMGYNSEASGEAATAMGHKTSADGDNSTAFGFESSASGDYSTAMGYYSRASGVSSTAMGSGTRASGAYSTAMGETTTASGDYSTAMGENTTASAYASTVIGRQNVGGGSPTQWIDSEPLFEIGNYGGFPSTAISNAMTVLKNGYTAVGSHLAYPLSVLEVVHENTPPTPTNLGQAFSIRNKNANEAWQMHVDDGGTLHLYRNGNYRGYFHSVNGNHVSVSDRRRKAQIETLPQGTLDQLLQLRPVSYYMKDQKSGDRNLGLIAQEVDAIFPTIAKYDAEADLYSLSYTELIPVLIKAVQEQQALIEAQKEQLVGNAETLGNLEARLNALEKMMVGGNSKK